jgi:hypothetical protein
VQKGKNRAFLGGKGCCGEMSRREKERERNKKSLLKQNMSTEKKKKKNIINTIL